MDPHRFDTLVKTLPAGQSRRDFARRALAGLCRRGSWFPRAKRGRPVRPQGTALWEGTRPLLRASALL
jgi:hypothetical protein